MKRTIIFILLVFLANSLNSQDLIVTNEGDSINCKITGLKKDHIYFSFKHKDEIRSTLLSVKDIKEHQFNYFKETEVPDDKVIGFVNDERLRIAINGGYSYQTAKIADGVPADFRNYVKELKSGYHFSADFSYFFSESMGFGLKYCLFKTSNSLDNIYIEDNDGFRIYGKMSDDLNISFIGPSFSTKMSNQSNGNTFIINFSLGYIGYSNDKVIISNYKMTGSTLGLALDIGYDIKLSRNFSLGFQISSITGALSEFDWNDGTTTETIKLEKGKYESLNRLDFSVGLRFRR
jgi:hypothetical protein